MSVRVALLADHPELLPNLAAAFERDWPAWYGVHGDATADLRERCRKTGLPIGFIALDEGHAVGTLAIAERCPPSHPHLSPWVIGFWVGPWRRNQGIGALLLKSACEQARSAGFSELYTCTNTAARLFVREGWTKVDMGITEGGAEVEVFALPLS